MGEHAWAPSMKGANTVDDIEEQQSNILSCDLFHDIENVSVGLGHTPSMGKSQNIKKRKRGYYKFLKEGISYLLSCYCSLTSSTNNHNLKSSLFDVMKILKIIT